jgi:hypothetical protein
MYPYEGRLEAMTCGVGDWPPSCCTRRHLLHRSRHYHPGASVEGVMATGIRAIVSRLLLIWKSVLGSCRNA